MAHLQNKAGAFVEPSVVSGQAALADAHLPEDLRAWIPDPENRQAYPIVTYTWLLCHKKYEDPRVAAELKNVIKYGLNEGQKFSAELGYIPLPQEVAVKVLQAVERLAP
jgi:phosphate transport system substrate-binding protein